MGFCRNSGLKLENISVARMGNSESLDTQPPKYGQLAYIHTETGALNLAEHYFRGGIEVSQRIGSDHYFNILNHSVLALLYSKQGRWTEALTTGKEALHLALAQGGMITPICEMILGAICMEMGNRGEAKERLENTAVLLRNMDLEATLLADNSGAGIQTIKSLTLENTKNKEDTVPQEKTDTYLFRIQMFGPFRVFHEDEELEATRWRTVKSRELLAYLAHHDKPVSTAQILEDLWPNFDLDKASTIFHTTLYYLRRHLQRFTDKEIIIHGSKRYQLRPGSILIDRRQFEETAQSALKKPMTGVLANELETAVRLYRGDYLEDLDYQWVIPVREELKNINSELKRELAVYYLQNSMYSRAVIHLRQLMKLKPYSEEVLRLLLTTLARMGDLSAIKEYYAVFTQTIAEELGLRPSSEMAAFYKELCGYHPPARKNA